MFAFLDRRVLQHYLEQGAACVLEGLDILEAEINALAASLESAQATMFSNATAFFSQFGNEAYRGHLDTDDVLVIHVAGEKLLAHPRAPAAASRGAHRSRRGENGARSPQRS